MYDVTRLKTEMLKRGWTEVALAKKAHMAQSTLNGIFSRGSGHPDSLKKICKALDMELEDIVLEEQSA